MTDIKIKITSKVWTIRLKDKLNTWYAQKGYDYVVKYKASNHPGERIAYFYASGTMGGVDLVSAAKDVYELVVPIHTDPKNVEEVIYKYLTSQK